MNSCVQRGLSALPFVQRWTRLNWYKLGPSASKTNISDSCHKIRGRQGDTGIWQGAKDISPSPPSQSPSTPRRDCSTFCSRPDWLPSDFLHIHDDSHVSFTASWFTKCFYVTLLAHHSSLRARLWRGPRMTLSASLLISSLNLGEITYLPKDGDRSLAVVGPPLVSIAGEPVNCYLPRELSFISLWDGSLEGEMFTSPQHLKTPRRAVGTYRIFVNCIHNWWTALRAPGALPERS